MQGITPSPIGLQSYKALMDPTTYTVAQDNMMSAATREALNFAPGYWPSQFGSLLALQIQAGHFYNGSALTEKGCRTTGNVTSGNSSVTTVDNVIGAAVGMSAMIYTYSALTFTGTTTNGGSSITSPSSTAGLFVGMPLYGPGLQPGTTISSIGASVGISKPANAAGTAVTIMAMGFIPLVPVGTVITAVGSNTLTLSQNATGTKTGAFILIGQPIGFIANGTTASGNDTITNIPTKGAFVGMRISGAGIPANTTILAIPSATSIKMSANASASATVPVTVSIAPPAANSRIDYITVGALTGDINYTMGTPAVSPVAPALPAGQLPICFLQLATGATSLGPNDISDIRDLGGLGLQSGAYAAYSALPTVTLGMMQGTML